MDTKGNSELENYWSKRYIDESTGWDLGEVAPPLKAYFDQLEDKTIKILIPGAGNAYEAEYLFQNGFKNTYVMDISKLPLKNFQERVPSFPSEKLIHGDFFAHKEQYDLIIEQTFFCSFPPVDNIRERYHEQMLNLLLPQGKLVGLWFNIPFSGDLTKRPFGATEKEYRDLLSNGFDFMTFTEAHNSISKRQGDELFGILRKK